MKRINSNFTGNKEEAGKDQRPSVVETKISHMAVVHEQKKKRKKEYSSSDSNRLLNRQK